MSDFEFLNDEAVDPKGEKPTQDKENANNSQKQNGVKGIFSKYLGKNSGGSDDKESSSEPSNKDEKKSIAQNPKIMVTGAVSLVAIVGAMLVMATGSKDDSKNNPAMIEQPTNAQVITPEDQLQPPQTEQQSTTDTRDYFAGHSVRMGLPAEHWARQQDPLNTLAVQAIDRSMVKLVEWNPTNSGLNIAQGVTYVGHSSEFANLKNQAIQALQQSINHDIQVHTDKDGKMVILERSSPEAVASGSPEFDVVKTATAYDKIASNAETAAVQIWADIINQARNSLPPPPVATPEATTINQGISDAQRAEYNRLLQEADNWQKQLVLENKRYKEELAAKDKQMIEILQKVEDNPKAVANLRANMISTKTNLKVQAIQGDLVFLEDKDGKLHTVRLGESVPGTDLKIGNIDANTGLVFVTNK